MFKKIGNLKLIKCRLRVEVVSKRQNLGIAYLFHNTSSNFLDQSLLHNFGAKQGRRPYEAIAFINATLPIIFITRFMFWQVN
jgi:hypothetical protein